MATIKLFEDIQAWQSARILCDKIFIVMNETSLKNDYKLKEQINGASGSIMDNIAEGFGRAGNNEFIQFLEIAHASACETQSQLYRIKDRNYISEEHFIELYALANESKNKIIALVNYLKTSPFKGVKFKDRT
jgi:four helix bundle protein